MESDRNRTGSTEDVGRILVELGGRVRSSLDRIREAFGAASESEEAVPARARALSELDSLKKLFAPWIELSRWSSPDRVGAASPGKEGGEPIGIEPLIEELLEAHPSLSVRVRGELGIVHGDRERLARCLSTFLGAVGGAPAFVRREVHVPDDQIVFSTRLPSDNPTESYWSPIVIAHGVAHALSGDVEIDRDSTGAVTLTLGVPVSSPTQSQSPSVQEAPSAEGTEDERTTGPVLAFRREGEPRGGVVPEGGESGVRHASFDTTRGTPARVALVVEEEPTARRYMTEMLQTEGFAVETAPSVRAAHERALEAPPDVLIVEQIQLRRERGREDFLRSFQSNPALARVPVILVRNPENDDERERDRDRDRDRNSSTRPTGPSEYGFVSGSVAKPIDSDEFLSVLRAVVKGPRPASVGGHRSPSRPSPA
jgi:CheY-like chemotaxis protein